MSNNQNPSNGTLMTAGAVGVAAGGAVVAGVATIISSMADYRAKRELVRQHEQIRDLLESVVTSIEPSLSSIEEALSALKMSDGVQALQGARAQLQERIERMGAENLTNFVVAHEADSAKMIRHLICVSLARPVREAFDVVRGKYRRSLPAQLKDKMTAVENQLIKEFADGWGICIARPHEKSEVRRKASRAFWRMTAILTMTPILTIAAIVLLIYLDQMRK